MSKVRVSLLVCLMIYVASAASASLVEIDTDIALDDSTGLQWYRDLSRFSEMTRVQQASSLADLSSEIGGTWRLATEAEVGALTGTAANFDLNLIFDGNGLTIESIITVTNVSVVFNDSLTYDIDWGGRVADEEPGGNQKVVTINNDNTAVPAVSSTTDETALDTDTETFGAWVVREQSTVGVNVDNPGSIALLSNYPNPFNPRTSIEFSLARQQEVNLGIFDLRGLRIKTLISDNLPSGQHRRIWDGTDQNGREMPSGTYLFRLKMAETTMTRKMMLVR